MSEPEKKLQFLRGQQDSPPRSSSSSSILASSVPTMKSPEDWNHVQWQEQHHGGSESNDSPLLMRSLECLFSDVDENRDASVKSTLNRKLWNDDSNDDESRNDTHQAIEEAQLQVSFAEQTAREMNEVLEWWSNDESMNVSQSRLLKDNSLVYASAHSSDELDESIDCMTNDKSLFLSLLPSNTNQDSCSLQAFLSPIQTVDSPQRLAQEQSFAVDEVCSEAKRMKDTLADLQDSISAVKGTNAPTSFQHWHEPRQCCLNDLSWLERLYVVAKCTVRYYSLRLQQWLYHVLPPSLISYWLAYTFTAMLWNNHDESRSCVASSTMHHLPQDDSYSSDFMIQHVLL